MESLPKKLRQLSAFLVSDAVGDDAMLMSELDGFLTGVIVSRDPIDPGEWLPLIWGADPPSFESEMQQRHVNELIMGHYNDLIRQLDQDDHRPIFEFDADDVLLWDSWIDGFWYSMNLRPQEWLDDDDADEELHRAVFVLDRLHEIALTPPEELTPQDTDKELTEMAPDLIPDAVGILLDNRPARYVDPVGSNAETIPKVGRNDPCPCGSGKKFKNCCLN